MSARRSFRIAEVPERERVFDDLFETTGSEVCMRPISDYAAPTPGIPYGAYVAAAHRAGHLAIGYRAGGTAGSRDLTAAIHLDPPKSKLVDLAPDDRLIIVVRRDSDPALVPAVSSAAAAVGRP